MRIYICITSFQKHCLLLIILSPRVTWCYLFFLGAGKKECIQCAEGHLQQEWRCVRTCTPGYYSAEAAGVPHKMCHRWVMAILSLRNITCSSLGPLCVTASVAECSHLYLSRVNVAFSKSVLETTLQCQRLESKCSVAERERADVLLFSFLRKEVQQNYSHLDYFI